MEQPEKPTDDPTRETMPEAEFNGHHFSAGSYYCNNEECYADRVCIRRLLEPCPSGDCPF